MTDQIKLWIDNASYEELLYRWQHSHFSDPIFHNDVVPYYAKVMSTKSEYADTIRDADLVQASKMVKLYLDTEFNGFGGKLMSFALVPENTDLPNFYCELEMYDQLDPWVKANVVPNLLLIPYTYNKFQELLSNYLNTIGKCTIVADWPDDIRYFCEALIAGPGDRINVKNNIKFELNFDIKYTSQIPHHALYDAMGIRDFYSKK